MLATMIRDPKSLYTFCTIIDALLKILHREDLDRIIKDGDKKIITAEYENATIELSITPH